MKHNYIKSLAIIAMLLLSMSVMAASDAVRVHGIYYNLIGDEATVTSGDYSYSGYLVIPSSFNYNGKTYSVTSIGYHAFYSRTDLVSVTIPESVISIDNEAFCLCSNLISMSIPDGMKIICERAFASCRRLTSVTIGSGLQSMAMRVFEGCPELTSITVKTGNSKFDSRNGCNAIIETNNNMLIAGCKNTIIPNTVTSIGVGAFYNCSSLTSLTIPNSVKAIGDYGFYGCSNLTSITIPNSVKAIGDYGFYGCSNLTSITIPNSVKTIGEYSFSGCRGLTSVNISNSITSISNYAFQYCTSLTSVNIPNSVTSIGNSAFRDCNSLTSINIPNGVTSINNYAFYGCSSLTSITIPSSVTNIGESGFYNCTGLTSIKVLREEPAIIGNYTFRYEYGSSSYQIKATLYVPAGCSSVYKSASNWNNFTTIIETTPEVEGISYVFDKENLVAKVTAPGINKYTGSIVIPSTVTYHNETYTVTGIESDAFSGCTDLVSVSIPESMTSIDNEAFSDCTNLRGICCRAEETPEINQSAFDRVDISAVTLVVPDNSIEQYRSHPVWGQFMIEDVTGINSTMSAARMASESYDLNGRRQNTPRRGLNIIRMSDGTTKKVMMR